MQNLKTLLLVACLIVSQVAYMSATCRSLQEKIYYEYKAGHGIDATSSVILDVKRLRGRLHIFISTRQPAGGVLGSRILHSPDLGRHWLASADSDLATPLALAGSRFVAAPSRPSMQYKSSGSEQGYVRSYDNGRSWVRPKNRVEGLALRDYLLRIAGIRSARTVFSLAAIHPRKPLVVYVTIASYVENNTAGKTPNFIQLGLFRSEDGGEHWTRVASDIEYGSPVGIDPSAPSTMFAYSNRGIVKTNDSGKTWSPIPHQRLLQERPLYRAEQHGAPILGAPVALRVQQFAIDSKRRFVYMVSNKGIFRSGDMGSSWCLLNTGFDFLDSINSLAFDPGNDSTLVVGTRFGVLLSNDHGMTFTRIYPVTIAPKYQEPVLAHEASHVKGLTNTPVW